MTNVGRGPDIAAIAAQDATTIAAIAVTGLDALEIGATLTTADADNQEASGTKQENETANGDANFASEGDGLVFGRVGVQRDGRWRGDVHRYGGEGCTRHAQSNAGVGHLATGGIQDGDVVLHERVCTTGAETGLALGDHGLDPALAVIIRADIDSQVVVVERVLEQTTGGAIRC